MILVPVLIWSISEVRSQTGCPNSGFEDGTFTGWTGGTGSCCPITITTPGLVTGRHTITSGTGVDPIAGVITVVAPNGGLHSARLGNSNVNSQAEQLSYTMTVDASNALFVYKYAVVLQDPQHPEADQPRFQIRMYDQNNLPIGCGIYNVTATSNVPGFVTTFYDGEILLYKDWTTVGIDLTPFIGQQVTIEFLTGDCALSGHFGYAYIDYSCGPVEIVSDYCPGRDVTTLEAPPGFASYLWSTGDTTSSIVVGSPSTGQQISVTLTSVTGCTATLNTILTPSIVVADFSVTDDCMNAAQFADGSEVLAGPMLGNWYWEFGDGTTSEDQDPGHVFPSPGSYQVQLIATNVVGCPDTMVQQVTILAPPVVDLTFGIPCLGEPMALSDVSTLSATVAVRRWNFGDGSPTESAGNVSHVYGAVGTYDVLLFVQDANGCRDSLLVPVTVNAAPFIDLGPDQALCPGEEVTIEANPAQAYLWNTQATNNSIVVSGNGTYWVDATDFGCVTRDTVLVATTPLPGELGSLVLGCLERPTTLTIPFANAHYQWDRGDTTQSISTGVSGDYAFTIVDAHGCTYGDIATLVLDPLELDVVVPNVITPNGDGHNDKFKPLTESLLVWVSIVDRWGEEVFQANTLSTLWDGRRNGGEVPDGTYFYDVRYKSVCMADETRLRGTVTVLR